MREHYTLAERWRRGKTDVLGEKPIPMSLCITKIPNGLAYNQISSSDGGSLNGLGYGWAPLTRHMKYHEPEHQ